MQLRQTDTFERDAKRLDASVKSRLKSAIEKILRQPTIEKPLRHYPNFFSERVGHFRLIYRLETPDSILLYCFKNRDEVYDELQRLL